MITGNFKLFNMELTIRPNRLISEIQKEFNAMFPFLKLEFFKNRGGRQLEYTPSNIIRRDHKLGDGQVHITDGTLTIEPEMTVKQLEKNFKDEFSLAVQVFRRSGNIWLETTMTDDWTLGHQNEHGRELSTEKKKDEPKDFDLERDED
jgi:hypothetical protein